MVAKCSLQPEFSMTCINPRVFVDDQFPAELRSLVPTTLRAAYRAAEELIADSPIASIAERRGERGRIVAWSVDLAFSKLVETGALPFDKSWEAFEKPTGRYLALRASSSTITISQIADPAKQPRNVRFRENRRMSNQPFLDLPGFESDGPLSGEPHILLTHGYQELTFSHLCMPDPDHRNGYRYRSENLLGIPHAVETQGPPEEDTDFDLDELALLKEEVERYRRDHGSGS